MMLLRVLNGWWIVYLCVHKVELVDFKVPHSRVAGYGFNLRDLRYFVLMLSQVIIRSR